MKPLEAVQNLSLIRQLTMQGSVMPPFLRVWFCGAIDQRLRNSDHSLDQLLGLSSRKGGRLHANSKLPQLHNAIQSLAVEGDTIGERARHLAERVARHHRVPDNELTQIERQFGRIPGTQRQLTRILAGQTESIRQST
jgi:hypothetical protein